jgi:hypothetical protein
MLEIFAFPSVIFLARPFVGLGRNHECELAAQFRRDYNHVGVTSYELLEEERCSGVNAIVAAGTDQDRC